MLKVSSKIFHLSPIYPITSFGVLGVLFILAFFKPHIALNKVLRVLILIPSVIVIAFIFFKGFTIATASGILAAAVLPGFPFAGGLLIHVIFEHGLGGALGLLLSMKPGLLQKAKVTMLKKE